MGVGGKVVRVVTYFQKGYWSEEPMTFCGMPRTSRMADRSWEPRPPRIRHIVVV